ncbi:MAG: 2'-deoxycytidine 5'-triphosphate deaminase [Rhodothalassiaceae bacterium]
MPPSDKSQTHATGILPAQCLAEAIERGEIVPAAPLDTDQIQPASIDLRLGDVAYQVPASFLPGRRARVSERLELLTEQRLDLGRDTVLERGRVYLVPLLESLALRARTSGRANPKSSTGRLDVFCRVITDYGSEFDSVPAGYRGPLWLEIAPRSFHVLVRRGSRLAQLRLKRGSPPTSDSFVRRLNESLGLVQDPDGEADVKDGGIALSVDLEGSDATGLIGYKARRHDEPIDIDRRGHYDVDAFWDRVYRPQSGGIVLRTDEFYILSTKERVAVPPDMAADMVAYDTLVGEFRVHYAGFFDPGFGYHGSIAEGTKIVLEVRSHEVPFIVEHGQIVGRVLVERLLAPTDRPYGTAIGSNYFRQSLTLGKQFRR